MNAPVGMISLSSCIIWIVTSAFQYGFHIAALNASQASITCTLTHGTGTGRFGLPTCTELAPSAFGILTSSFTVGGLLASILASRVSDAKGRKFVLLCSAASIFFGSGAMAFGTGLMSLLLGRFVIGLGAGASTVVVPLFLAEISPVAIRGRIGVFNQLSICAGILSAQALSIPFTRLGTGNWRVVPLISGAIALLQILAAPMMIESPKWVSDQTISASREAVEEEAGLLGEDQSQPSSTSSQFRAIASENQPQLSFGELFNSKDAAVRIGLSTVLFTQFYQQFSGINAVLSYSTAILSTIMPEQAQQVALYVAAINLLTTFIPVLLIEKVGRKPLMLISASSMSICSALLGIAINRQYSFLAAASIIAFVAAFSTASGAVPFILMSEVPPPHARSATASAGLALNWSSNVLIGLFFLPVRDMLGAAGNVFFVFAIISAIACVHCSKLLR